MNAKKVESPVYPVVEKLKKLYQILATRQRPPDEETGDVGSLYLRYALKLPRGVYDDPAHLSKAKGREGSLKPTGQWARLQMHDHLLAVFNDRRNQLVDKANRLRALDAAYAGRVDGLRGMAGEIFDMLKQPAAAIEGEILPPERPKVVALRPGFYYRRDPDGSVVTNHVARTPDRSVELHPEPETVFGGRPVGDMSTIMLQGMVDALRPCKNTD